MSRTGCLSGNQCALHGSKTWRVLLLRFTFDRREVFVPISYGGAGDFELVGAGTMEAARSPPVVSLPNPDFEADIGGDFLWPKP